MPKMSRVCYLALVTGHVWLISYKLRLSHMGGDVGQIESIIGVQWGQKNPTQRAHRSSGKRGLPSFPLNGVPEGWDFSGTTEHQRSILFLIYHDRTVQYWLIYVGDVTEVDVYSQLRAMYKST